MKGFGLSDVGKKRLVNQDSFYGKELSDDCFYAVVCDGMGGAAGGGVASSIAKDVYCTELEKRLKLYFETKEGSAATVLPRMMRESVQVCNSFTYELSEGDRSLKGMGTTLVSALVYKSQIFLCNVGDSRAYGFSEKKSVQLTKDHSFVQELIDCGKMTEKEAKKSTQKKKSFFFLLRLVGGYLLGLALATFLIKRFFALLHWERRLLLPAGRRTFRTRPGRRRDDPKTGRFLSAGFAEVSYR